MSRFGLPEVYAFNFPYYISNRSRFKVEKHIINIYVYIYTAGGVLCSSK